MTVRRPKCHRCNGPLDLCWDEETGGVQWSCNNPGPALTDVQFQERWASLSGDDAVRLDRQLGGTVLT